MDRSLDILLHSWNYKTQLTILKSLLHSDNQWKKLGKGDNSRGVIKVIKYNKKVQMNLTKLAVLSAQHSEGKNPGHPLGLVPGRSLAVVWLLHHFRNTGHLFTVFLQSSTIIFLSCPTYKPWRCQTKKTKIKGFIGFIGFIWFIIHFFYFLPG